MFCKLKKNSITRSLYSKFEIKQHHFTIIFFAFAFLVEGMSMYTRAGFSSEWLFIQNIVVNVVCGLYCGWLSLVARKYLWNLTSGRAQSVSRSKEVQSVSEIEVQEVNKDTTFKEQKPRVAIHRAIRWIVFLYVVGCSLFCIGTVCERMIFALAIVPGRACNEALYVSYLRVLTDGLFFTFYVVRTSVILRGSFFEISKCRQYFFGITPVLSFNTLLITTVVYTQFHHCAKDSLFNMLVIASVICHFFWSITLFVFLIYYLRK
ncbi:hypothetical protein RFI_07985, partial [Reticulomyxa filosa]